MNDKQLRVFLTEKTKLSEADITVVCGYFKPVKAERHTILIDFYEVCSSYYFINKGAARIYARNAEGEDITRYFAFKNSFFTALPSFISQKPSHEYLQTIEKSELLVISRTDFYKLVHQFPDFERLYRENLEKAFIVAQERIYGFQGFSAQEKVEWVIKNQPEILLNISNKMAASYLGMSPSTLSRMKAKL